MSTNEKFSLVHETSKRLRYKVNILKDNNINENSLMEYFSDMDGLANIRVNSKAASIVFNFTKNIKNELEDKLHNISLEKLLQTCTTINECTPCIGEGEPSLKGLVRAGAVLVAEPLISNTNAKAALTTAACMPLIIDGAKELFTEGLTSKFLEASAVAISIARQDFLAANSANAMLELGEYIEETTVHKSDDLLKQLAKPNVEEAWVEKNVDGKITEILIKTKDIEIGDIVVVGAGSTIPIDGHIVYGEASVNQVSMTGEAEPVKKQRSDRVISGTVMEEGRIKIWAEHVGSDTATQRIKHYIENSLSEKSSVQLKATKLADKLVPVTLGLAGVAYAFSRDFERVASVLQADYSCALKLATPVAFKTAISKAGHAGIMIKGAKAVEALHSADTFIFDKTGTLTEGELEVVNVTSFDEKWTEDALLNLTASTEEHYFHPVAEAVVKAAKKRGFVHMHHEEVEFIVAHGVKTQVNGKNVLIGSRHFLEEDEGISFKKHKTQIDEMLSNGFTLLYVGYGKKLLGTISLEDRLRSNTKETIQRLKKMGVKNTIMLTGDTLERAEKIAKEVGIDTVYASLLPTQKASIVKELMDEGKKVAFIGDGINDAPALISA
ncbi:MAG: heavy metal translocating P-type ATPase, partial [Campylobacteraceae bacterium]|nr:heavy metal translocating P-type ATPase [Campylobacteraceae bacterium]